MRIAKVVGNVVSTIKDDGYNGYKLMLVQYLEPDGTPTGPRLIAFDCADAGVGDIVRFEVADAAAFDRKTERGVIVTNPPYGERIMEKAQAEALYSAFGAAWRKTENWQLYLLSSHTEFERCFGKTADKKRKLYNGMIKCDLFMYFK